MDIDTGYILHSETVDKREVALQSPNMEKEAFVRSLQFLQTHILCKEIITDASTSIRKEMGKPSYNIQRYNCLHWCLFPATKHADIFHSLDVWHKSKKIRKALAKVRNTLFVKCNTNTPVRLQAGKVKNMNKLQQWSGNIINHFWHCCKTCEGDPMKLKVQPLYVLQLHHLKAPTI